MGNSTETTSTGAKKTITVSTQDGDVVVRRLALLDYAGLLRAFKKLPGELMGFIDGTDKEDLNNMAGLQVAERLLPLIAESWEDFIAVLAVPTDKDYEFISEMDAADALEVLAAVLELNNYKRIIATVKKLMPQKPEAPTDESAASAA